MDFFYNACHFQYPDKNDISVYCLSKEKKRCSDGELCQKLYGFEKDDNSFCKLPLYSACQASPIQPFLVCDLVFGIIMNSFIRVLREPFLEDYETL